MAATTPPNYGDGAGKNGLDDMYVPKPSDPQSSNPNTAGFHTGFGHTSHPANRVPNVRELPIPKGK